MRDQLRRKGGSKNVIGYCIIMTIWLLIVWAKNNRWSENDTQNFAQAARHGSRMDKRR